MTLKKQIFFIFDAVVSNINRNFAAIFDKIQY